MYNSEIRMSYIAEYISAYESKIKLLNAEGLFDAAKLFELFAIEVGSLYFNQKLINLNIEKFNYPTVDLISEDKTFYVQVSTEKDISDKIKHTLEKIKTSNDPKIKSIKCVKFFVLNNEKVSGIRDLVGKNQIGDIPFTRKDDLITTADILGRAMHDFEFQCKLFELLHGEEQSVQNNLSKWKEAIQNSKVDLENIDCKINNEYEIDRTDIIDRIKADGYKNITVQGYAGCGKSALCKLLLQSEPNLIFARAERFLEESDINSIWGFNIRETLTCLSGKPVVFFIDALEFIADCKTKLDLLNILYDCTKDYPNVRIVTSCRTSDRAAFIKLEGNYNIHVYEVGELTGEQQLNIAKKFPIIAEMTTVGAYRDLLRLPLYVNLIVSHISEIKKIEGENRLREYIWENIICRKKKKYMDLINDIVFTRAKSLSVGVSVDGYELKDIDDLVSNGVLVKNADLVRLKYDMFEDICFEHFFDHAFDECKGDYKSFFERIADLSLCVYRRYQIWIENKLLVKSNRNKFLYELVFSKTIPDGWKEQTQIGLIKSRHSKPFFTEYGKDLIETNLLKGFIRLTNLYGFEINSSSASKYFITLNAGGAGRACLIHLVASQKWYVNNASSWMAIRKLCNDYTKYQSCDKEIALDCLNILGYIIKSYFPITSKTDIYKFDEKIKGFILPIYTMAEHTGEWIKTFWSQIIEMYMSGERNKVSVGRGVIEYTLRFDHIALAKYLPEELCDLAEIFWTRNPEIQEKPLYGLFQRDSNKMEYLYGLSQQAENYEHGSTYEPALYKSFFLVLFRTNFWKGLHWAIRFINRAVDKLSDHIKADLPINSIYFVETGNSKGYVGFEEMWLVTTREHSMPMLLSDLIYCLKYEIFNILYVLKDNNKDYIAFANNVKKVLLDESNNIALLTIVSDIGMQFEDDLPGYAVDLVSDIHLVLFDLTRYSMSMKNSTRELLENQLLLSVGVPHIDNRYSKYLSQTNLLNYFIKMSLCRDITIKEKCVAIVDYLYSIIPNDEEHAIEYLQIQKMDVRRFKLSASGDGYVTIEPTVSGAAGEVTKERERANETEKIIVDLINECNNTFKDGQLTLDHCVDVIDWLIAAMKKSAQSFAYENSLIAFICFAVSHDELDDPHRDEYCDMWIDGIYRILHSTGTFTVDFNFSIILFVQIEKNINPRIKNRIKRLMLDCILYRGPNGIIHNISRLIHNYLVQKPTLSKIFFNTIVKLSEDEMNRQKYNAAYITSHRSDGENISFIPNMQSTYRDVDYFIKENGGVLYKGKRDEIIDEYLYNGEQIDLSAFTMSDYEISVMSYAINCVASLEDDAERQVVKKYILELINMYQATSHTYDSNRIVSVFQASESEALLQRELLLGDSHADIVLGILFDDIDFSKFNYDTIEYYQEVFGVLLAYYFDSHADKTARRNCENIIYKLEEKVNAIQNTSLKIQLYRSLIFAPTRSGGAGDWSQCPSSYSYQDKKFLNKIFGKYGGYHLSDLIEVIVKLHIHDLLPEILDSVRIAFENCIKFRGEDAFIEIVNEKYSLIIPIITEAFLDFNEKIKEDAMLIESYEWILSKLRDIGYAEAAVILDEFRIH